MMRTNHVRRPPLLPLLSLLLALAPLVVAAVEADLRPEDEHPIPSHSVIAPEHWVDHPGGSIATMETDGPLSDACKAQQYTKYVRVRTTIWLQFAVRRARPGTMIELLPGTYDRRGLFNLTVTKRRGTPENPITICGPRDAVITAAGSSYNKAYVLLVRSSSYVRLLGFSLTRGFKGLVIEDSENIFVEGLKVWDTDYEAIRIRYASTNCVIKGCEVTDTGKTSPGTGEGIYVGSSFEWGVDVTLNIQLLNNRIGPGVTAECIDIKENTFGGVIEGNTFDGAGLQGVNYADSWVDVKGAGWVVRNNVGRNTPKDGFQTHDQPGKDSGKYNVFHSNSCDLGGAAGDCVAIYCEGPNENCYNLVSCNNAFTGQSGEMTNLAQCAKAPPA